MSPFDRVLAAIGNATGGRPSNIEAAAEAIAALAEIERERDELRAKLAEIERELATRVHTTCSQDGTVQVIDPESRTITEYHPPKDAYKIQDFGSLIRIMPKGKGTLTLFNSSEESEHTKVIGAIRHLMAERDELRAKLDECIETVESLETRQRRTAQVLIECIGADGPENAEEAAERAVGVIERQAGRIAKCERQEPVAYRYKFPSPLGHRWTWRWSPEQYNGSLPVESQALYAHPLALREPSEDELVRISIAAGEKNHTRIAHAQCGERIYRAVCEVMK